MEVAQVLVKARNACNLPRLEVGTVLGEEAVNIIRYVSAAPQYLISTGTAKPRRRTAAAPPPHLNATSPTLWKQPVSGTQRRRHLERSLAEDARRKLKAALSELSDATKEAVGTIAKFRAEASC